MYPNKEDLGRYYLPADIDTSDIFDRSRLLRPPSGGIGRRSQSLPTDDGNKEFDQLHDPSSIYHDHYSQPLSRDPPSARYTDEASDSYNKAPKLNYSSWEHISSHSSEVPHELPPIPVSISDCSYDASSSQSYRTCMEEGETRKPVQVEVYPGKFLQLRGAKETFAAIEQGHSQSVFCYACGLGLRCVADCELVICPDCRIMSPVPRRRPACLFEDDECEEEDDTSYRYRGSLPQSTPLWSDDEEEEDDDSMTFHTSKQKSNTRGSHNGSSRVEVIGGVGLGLKIEHY